jgi:hypothetical protein
MLKKSIVLLIAASISLYSCGDDEEYTRKKNHVNSRQGDTSRIDTLLPLANDEVNANIIHYKYYTKDFKTFNEISLDVQYSTADSILLNGRNFFATAGNIYFPTNWSNPSITKHSYENSGDYLKIGNIYYVETLKELHIQSTSSATKQKTRTYIVKKGDTAFSLRKRGIPPNNLTVGSKITY